MEKGSLSEREGLFNVFMGKAVVKVLNQEFVD